MFPATLSMHPAFVTAESTL